MRVVTLRWMPARMQPRCGWTGPSGLAVVTAATAVLVAVIQAPAGAATNPYVGSGYDAASASAQCTTSSYPPGFAIIGVGAGRPFTTSACSAREWSLAPATGTPATPSLYFNTGYAGAYAKQITAGCMSAVSNAPIPPGTSGHRKTTEQQAWEIGCSEAAYAAAHAPGTPAMWWADVETGNSWSTNTTYNDLAIDGLAYEMASLGTTTGAGGGVYSTPAMWSKIAGTGFVPTPAVTADWEPVTACPAAGFSGSPVWLIQNGTVTASTVAFDADQAC